MAKTEQQAQSPQEASTDPSHQHLTSTMDSFVNYGQFEEWKYKFTAHRGLNNNRCPVLREQKAAATHDHRRHKARGVASTTEER